MTNLEGFRKYGDSWKKMDETDLQAYLGLLILAGVYRSRGEAATTLWDAESGRPIFRATMPLKLFHTYSRLIRFDDRESKPARCVTDKLAAIREVWDNVVLLSTLHTDGDISDREDRKPVIIVDYNRNKGGVDNLDKVIGTYSCRRMTARWPLVIFHIVIDVSSYNAFVIWREINPTWMSRKQNKRRVFLEQLGKALVIPLIERMKHVPHTEASAAVVKAIQSAGAPDQPEDPATTATSPARASKRKRCQLCPQKKDCKTHTVCCRCKKYICKGCTLAYCPTCAN
ncbi:piggyBac transposable element-derived protein 4-like [Entelurus aequoreus]|uniref:piggyBac transposable element-derived protein 4-like n=1 Tax=Entelurus aequoreus TaxID=161455 RepID=UPI002B1D3B25|nr:piggyBac transposable element-derived protein 4-like [Entelurus aequoreus]XP_061899655.1 piggyBac transposable element-derived protein 4-like [Entelurus aequoreus]